MAKGAGGSWDDTAARFSSIIQNDNEWWAYYYGRSDNTTKHNIGLATAPIDQPYNMTKYGSNPILSYSDYTFSAGGMHGVAVVKDPYESDTDKKFKLWVDGTTSGGTEGVGYFTSPNGKTSWTLQGTVTGLPATTQAYYFVYVIQVGKIFIMFVEDNSANVDAYWSNDGQAFTLLKDDVIPVGGVGDFDEKRVRYYSAYNHPTGMYFVYSGQRSSDNKWQIGIAHISNILSGNAFTKLGAINPILTWGWTGGVNGDGVNNPCIQQYNKDFYMWYNRKYGNANDEFEGFFAYIRKESF